MSEIKKLIKRNKVAVLVSPGFGAGWSTWNRDFPDMVFDADIVSEILRGDFDSARTIAESKYPEAYLGGLEDLTVAWVPVGKQFEIWEYDGSESLHIIGDGDYYTA